MRTDQATDIRKLTVIFQNYFGKAPKNVTHQVKGSRF